MKIKSLLLGSAAAILAVTGAQAADPVMVEAEPMEYVRICDAYGAGYFFIPGTETCLKIGGYVRVQWNSDDYHEGWEPDNDPTERHGVKAEALVGFTAMDETEWGTLRSVMVLKAGSTFSGYDSFSEADGPGPSNVFLDQALISLAGFRVGYSDDYWSSHGGYGYYNASSSGQYNFGQATFLDYTYSADGFRGTVGMATGRSGTPGQPDLYVGGDYSGSWGRVWGLYYQDSNQDSGAWKVGAEIALEDYLPGARIKGWYMSDDGDTDYVKGHTWGVTAKMDLTDNLGLYAGYSDYNWSPRSGYGYDFSLDTSKTHMSIGVRWDISAKLYLQTEYVKTNYDNQVRYDRLGVDQVIVRLNRSF